MRKFILILIIFTSVPADGNGKNWFKKITKAVRKIPARPAKNIKIKFPVPAPAPKKELPGKVRRKVSEIDALLRRMKRVRKW